VLPLLWTESGHSVCMCEHALRGDVFGIGHLCPFADDIGGLFFGFGALIHPNRRRRGRSVSGATSVEETAGIRANTAE
jgi:hypothetical protein